jgi:hypothetical protein
MTMESGIQVTYLSRSRVALNDTSNQTQNNANRFNVCCIVIMDLREMSLQGCVGSHLDISDKIVKNRFAHAFEDDVAPRNSI